MKEDLFKLLESREIPKDEYLENKINALKKYFSNFLQKFSSKNIYKLSELSEKDILLSSLIICNPYKTDETINLIDKCVSFFSDENYKKIFSIFETLTKEIEGTVKLHKILTNLNIPLNVKLNLTKFMKTFSIEDLKELFDNYTIEARDIVNNFLEKKYRFNFYYNHDLTKSLLSQLNSEERKILKKKYLPNENFSKSLLETASIYSEYINRNYNKIIKDYEQKEKERRRHNQNIKTLIELLDTVAEITDIDKILKLIPDEDLIETVLDYIIFHNKQIYLDALESYESLKISSDENLDFLFRKHEYNVALNNEELNIIKKIDLIDIENLLINLKNLSLLDTNITKVCVYKLSVITNLISKGLITKEWLKNNKEIIQNNNNLFELVLQNIELLSNNYINMISYNNSLNILKSTLLKYNLDLLKNYNLIITRNTTNINFLSDEHLREKIEFIISLGMHFNIESLDILNCSREEMYKLKISETINVPLKDIDIKEEDLTENYANLIIPEHLKNKLDNELETTIIDLPKYLEEYKLDKVTLDINGVLVSTEKVKRNLAKLDNEDVEYCFYAIIYKGYYTYEEIDILMTCLLEKKDLHNLLLKKK